MPVNKGNQVCHLQHVELYAALQTYGFAGTLEQVIDGSYVCISVQTSLVGVTQLS